MIQTSSETLIQLSHIPRHLDDLTGKRPHIATVYRWTKNGIAGVQLETLLVGGTRFTSAEALERFFKESTKAKSKILDSNHNRAALQRTAQIEEEAKRLGI